MRRLGAVAAVLVIVFITGCQTTVAVHVVVRPNGSGRVTVDVALDAQAASRAGDLAHQVALGDLRQAGWTVAGPVAQPGGGERFIGTKPFADSAGATRALAEVSGSAGPLRNMRVEGHRSISRSRDVVRGVIDLSRGVDAFDDPALVAALGGKQLSQLVAALRSPDDPPLSQSLRFQFTVTLPADVHAPGHRVTRHSASWQVGAGDRPVAIEASGTNEHTAARWYVLGAALAAALFLFSLWWAIRGIRRDRRHPRESAEDGAEPDEARISVASSGGEPSDEAHSEAAADPIAEPAHSDAATGSTEGDASASPPVPSDGPSASLPSRRHRRSLRRRGGGKHSRRRGRSGQ